MEPRYYGAAAHYNKPQQLFGFDKRLVSIIGVIIAVLIAVVLFFTILNAISQGPRNEIARLIAREQQLSRALTTNLKNVRNDELQKVGNEAVLYLGTDIAALSEIYNDDLPKEITESESNPDEATALQQAALVGRFDQALVDILRTRAAASLEQAQKVNSSATGQLTKTATANAIANLRIIQERLNAVTF